MRSLLVWALYDLANTFFAVAMLSFYFPLWVVEEHGAKELVFSIALSVSMVCVALLMPVCGAISDATGRRVRYLRWTTLGCIVPTILIGLTSHLPLALGLFIVANICYQLGTVFYDALLWRLTTPSRLGQASGLGAAFGYLGSMIGLLFLWPFVREGGHQAAFIPSACFFLLFALPSLIMLRDQPAESSMQSWRSLVRQAFLRLWTTLRQARAYSKLWRFFLASLFSLSAINTVLVFMAVYTKKVLGFDEVQVVRFFLWGQAFAVAGALVFGQVTQWLGSKRTLVVIWSGWIAALALVSLNERPDYLWAIAPVIGFCLGSTWSTSRVLLTELAPKDQLAEFLGLAGLLGRASSILGPLLWGLIVLDPSHYRQAVIALIGLLVIGLWILRKV